MAAPTREAVETLTRDLVDRGLLIEAGWVGLKHACDLHDAPQIQIDEMRQAFFAGAQHVFSSLMAMLEPGDDPTAADLSRMDKIDAELRGFIAEFEKKHGFKERIDG